ncbi:MAG: prepilin-type N-terminal cleavage/methylation domain-containing protein [Planctomycetes bacterium]|nr:prepilin-type N-terminal cleavage/methylation domain-containing protein [Planctomycetota bacterium]
MSSPRRRAAGGFTLLECLVAILILSLLVLGMVRLVSGHHEVLDSVDDWSYGDPVLYLVQDTDPMARAIGTPAALSVDPPQTVHVASKGAYDVTVLETFRDLDPPRSGAVFRLVESESEGKGKGKGKGKGEGKGKGKGKGDDDDEEDD